MNLKQTLRLDAASPADVTRAAACLRAGGLVGFPTETVYGLGADATSGSAVAGIYQAKGRPAFNPLIAHVPDMASALQQGEFFPAALALAKAFWPGPLTLVVPHRGNVCDLARAGLASVGLRIPGSAIARALIAASGRPIAAPSANRSGHVSPASAAHVLDDLDGRIDIVLDGGPCPVGVESTIVACLDDAPVLLRPGGISGEAIEAVLGLPLLAPACGGILAPGQLASHYAPKAFLRLNAMRMEPGEAGLDFAGQLAPSAALGAFLLDLSPGGDLSQAAASLFSWLRALDTAGATGVAVASIPDHGLGAAINDRLVRAAARN